MRKLVLYIFMLSFMYFVGANDRDKQITSIQKIVVDDITYTLFYEEEHSFQCNLAKYHLEDACLISEFADNGVFLNIFSNVFIDSKNILMTMTIEKNVMVVATQGSDIHAMLLDGITGKILGSFKTEIEQDAIVSLEKIISLHDGKVIALVVDKHNLSDDGVMYAVCIDSSGKKLDETFYEQGAIPGILPIVHQKEFLRELESVVTIVSVEEQQQKQQQNNVEFQNNKNDELIQMLLHDDEINQMLYRTSGQPGTLNSSNSMGTSGSPAIANGFGRMVFVYPSGNVNAGKILVGIDNGTTSVIARLTQSTMALDTGFGTSGIYTVSGSLRGVMTLSVDSNNNILAGGTNGSSGWVLVINNAGSSATAATFSGITVTSVRQILQQKSGRYIVAASTSSNGVLIALKDQLVSPATTLAIDPTFNPLSVGSAPVPGTYLLGTTGLYTIAINNDDTIYTAYANTASPNKIVLTKITADGSGAVSGFNSGSAVTTDISVDGSSVIRVNIDNSDNVVVAGSVAASHQVQVARYTSAGVFDSTFNSGSIRTITNLGTAGTMLTGMMVLTSNKIVCVGYNTGGGNGRLFAVRLAATGALDSTWNASPSSPDTAGVLTYAASFAVAIIKGAVGLDGVVLSIASTSGAVGSSVPVLTFVEGDTNIVQQSQNPLQSPAGSLDTTIPGGSSGAWALSGTITGSPKKISIYNNNTNGAVMIGSSDGTNSYVTKLNADLAIGTYGTSGVATLTGKDNLVDTYLTGSIGSDTPLPILVCGDDGGAMWGAVISADGSTVTYLANAGGLTSGNVIRQTSNGRILVAGYNGVSGCIAAFGSVTSGGTYPLDTSFGSNGVYATGVANQIYDMAVDSLDRIYIAYYDAGAIAVVRLLANGTGVDSSFSGTFSAAVNGYSLTQIRLALDEANDRLVVAAQDGTSIGNIIRLKRFNTGNGSGRGNATVTVAGAVLNLSDLFIDASQNIYVVGYNLTDNNSVVARVASTSGSTIALDTTNYAVGGGTPGIANVAAGSMTQVTAGAYNPDRRTYLVGVDGSSNGYMARLFGDIYTSQVSEAITTASVGTIDDTLQPGNTGAIDLSGQTGWSGLATGYKAWAVIENPTADGTVFIAFGNGTNVIVGCADADMVPVSTFGDSGSSNGLTATQTMTTVNSIMCDPLGNIIVSGTNSGAQKVLSFDSSGTFNATFATTVASTVGTTVVQQKSGRYIVGGYDGSANGLITAFKNESAISTSILPIDSTFGPTSLHGYYATGVNAQIDDLCIDSNDNIYFVYRDGSSNVTLGKLTANGSGLVSASNSPATFNSGAVVNTGIVANQPSRIAINSAGNILVGASTAGDGTPNTKVRLYNGSTGAAIATTQTVISLSTPILTKLVGAGTGFYGCSNKSTPSVTVFAMTNAGVLDSSFGNSGLRTSTTGSPQEMYGASVQADGKLVLVGYTTGPNPLFMRFYANQYIPQYAQMPGQANAGLLDTTLWPTSGALQLNTYSPISTTITTLAGSTTKCMYEYSNGKALFVCDGANVGADTVVMRVNKDLTLDTTFNTNGYVTISGKINVRALFLDSNSNIYVVGGSTTSWIAVYNSSGTALSGWSTATALTNGVYQVGVQTVDRVIVAGKNTNGTLYGYTTSAGLDTTFGSSGVVDMGSTLAITDFAIDSFDNIITVANNAGTVVLQKVSASGLTVTDISGNGTAITTATSGSNIKAVLDSSGNIVVAAATSTGFVLRRYTNNNSGGASGVDSAGPTSITGITGAVLANIYATSDGKITLVGYDGSGNIIVGRLTSAFALDTTAFNSSTGYISTTIGSLNRVYDAIIGADDRIMLAGGNGTSAQPYIGRIFGDSYVSYVSQGQTQGVAGTINPTFGDTTPPTGSYDISTLNEVLTGAQGKAILPLSNGGYYMAFDLANTAANSVLIKTVSSGALDTTYNSGVTGGTAGIAGSATSPQYAPLGVNSLLQDGSGRLLLVGATGGAGWVQRYTTAGALDTNFGAGTGKIASGTIATVAVEQTLARLVVAGRAGGFAALSAYTSLAPDATYTGTVDTTFNSTGSTPGVYRTTEGTHAIYSVIADQYDRLIFALLNSTSGDVDLYRLTPTGQADVTFGTAGIVAGAIVDAAGASSVHVALDSADRIIVAANSSAANTFSVAAYDNGTSTTTGGNGAAAYAQLNISSLTSPSLTNVITAADGYVLIVGTQSETNSAWVARITSLGALDTTGFNAAAVGGTAGIFKYSGSGATSHVYAGLAVNGDGTLGMLGYENSTGTYTPTLVGVYNDPYTSQTVQSPDSKEVGTNDVTLGVSSASATNKGITFYGATGDTASGQVARALGLYDDNNFVVAIDGHSDTGSGTSEIMMNMFDNDGIANPNFGTAGTTIVLSGYQNQYVRDMVTFTTAAGVTKAILAGYVTNTAISKTDSLLLQYILTPGDEALDSSFGGFDSNPVGVAFGDGQALYSVAQQSNGRIIAAGLSQDNLGLLLGYSSNGKMDNSFGNNGYQSVNTGSSGIYTHAVDMNNNIVFAYNNGSDEVAVARYLADGSALDVTFTTPTPLISTISGNSNMKIAIDSSNRVYVAGVIASGNSLMIKIYPSTGGTATATATYTGSQLGGTGFSVYTLGKMIVDIAGNAVIAAYDSGLQQTVVIRLTNALIKDTTFNSTGYLTYQVAGGSSSQLVTDTIIHADGRIFVSGSES